MDPTKPLTTILYNQHLARIRYWANLKVVVHARNHNYATACMEELPTNWGFYIRGKLDFHAASKSVESFAIMTSDVASLVFTMPMVLHTETTKDGRKVVILR